MSARVSKPRLVNAVCGSCGNGFSYRSKSGAPRTYCDDCAPRKSRRPGALPAVPKAASVRGKPLTMQHFRAWTRKLRLRGDEPLELERWEELYAADVFAAIRGSGVRELWLVVPEGNGKSTFVAVLILYLLEFVADSSIPIAASSRDQANIIYTQAAGFERRSPHLARRFKCKPGLREVTFRERLAKIFASDSGTGDGIIPFPIEVLDELHRHQSLDLYRTWAGKLDKEGAVLLVTSTAGEPGSEFEDVRERMRQEAVEVTRDGCFGRFAGSTFVLHEYAVPEGADVEDLEVVKAANPSSRITVESLAAKWSRPSWALPHWCRLTCNMPTRSDSAAIAEQTWDGAIAPEGRREIPEGEHVDAGLDLGWVYDTTALVPLWTPEFGFRLLGPATILTPPANGAQLDAHLVERALLELHERTPIDCVVMDMTRGEQLAQWIEEEIGCEVVNRAQSNPFQAVDYERFMEGLRERWLFHCGDPGLRRHVLNAVAQLLPGGQTRFNRPRPARNVAPELQRRRVIDALTAAGMVNTLKAAELVDGASGVVYA